MIMAELNPVGKTFKGSGERVGGYILLPPPWDVIFGKLDIEELRPGVTNASGKGFGAE